jgi:2-oxoglutarate ferredoxin oxidoreductase subunit delta
MRGAAAGLKLTEVEAGIESQGEDDNLRTMKKFLLQEPVEIVTPAGHRLTLLRHFCKGCRVCVDFCPTETLDLDDRFKITVAHPERCIGCRVCELRCPDLAIFVTKAERRTAKNAKGQNGSGLTTKTQRHEGHGSDPGPRTSELQPPRTPGTPRRGSRK